MSNKSGRNFTVSLKPAWSEEKIHLFMAQMIGQAKVWAINHDKDINEDGEKVETHTHILVAYSTPRKVSTVANVFEVESNFIEIVRNMKGMLRYLTHKDEEDKHLYNDDEVITNDSVPYAMTILGNGLSDKDIMEYLVQGRGSELLDVVSIQRIRALQSFLHFDSSNRLLNEVRDLNRKMDIVLDTIDMAKQIADGFLNGVKFTVEELTDGMRAIANQLNRSNNMLESRKYRSSK